MGFADIKERPPVTTGSIARYVLLPGILPRLKNLVFSFSKILFIFIQILGSIGLIDRAHPGLRPENIGRYTFGEMVAVAWSNVKWDRQNLPQAVMFCTVMASIALMATMLLIGAAYFIGNPSLQAHAQYFGASNDPIGSGYSNKNDWSLQMLERVFGSKRETGLDFFVQGTSTVGYPGNPWYTGLFIGMLKAYSKALLFIAIIMVVYLLLTALVRAARSGEPFGSQFDTTWAPIRFAIAIFMLVPISGGGYNAAQMVVFQVAEWGSNLATNLWMNGIKKVTTSTQDQGDYIGASVSNAGYAFLRDMFLINMCVEGYNFMYDQAPADVRGTNGHVSTTPSASMSDGFYNFNFGVPNVAPDFCGTVSIPVKPEPSSDYLASGRTLQSYLPYKLAASYYTAMQRFAPTGSSSGNSMSATANQLAKNNFDEKDKNHLETQCGGGLCSNNVQQWVYDYWELALGRVGNPAAQATPTSPAYSPANDHFMAGYKTELDAYNAWLTESLKKDARFGWASAGVFYMRMSYAMSTLNQMIDNAPRVSKLPANFYSGYATPEKPDKTIAQGNTDCAMDASDEKVCERYVWGQKLQDFLKKGAVFFAGAPKSQVDGNLGGSFYAQTGGTPWDAALKMSDKEATESTSLLSFMGPIQSYIYSTFKINGNSLHPLGQVIDWGNMFLGASAIAFAISMAAGVAGLLPFPGASVAQAVSTMTNTIGDILVVPGFLLVFIVPMLPFMYFTFAIIEWIASVVEAVIGMPLWALSFITLRGDIAAPAMQGIKILFEIMLRPSIIIMSLVSALLIFTATITFLNDSMALYMGAYGASTANNMYSAVNGVNVLGSFGMIFVYMFAVYLLANSIFKLIDIIPKYFGDWLSMSGAFNTSMGGEGALQAVGTAVAYTGVQVVKRGVKIGTDRVALKISSEVDKNEHQKWMYGQPVSYEKNSLMTRVMGAENFKLGQKYKLDGDGNPIRRKKEGEHDHIGGETGRVADYNKSAADYNSTLGPVNAMLTAQGKAPLAAREYMENPRERSGSYFMDAVLANRAAALAGKRTEFYKSVPNEMYNMPNAEAPGAANPPGFTGGNSAQRRQAHRTAARAKAANPVGAAIAAMTVNVDVTNNLSVYQQNIAVGGSKTGALSKLSGMSGKKYSVNDIEKALAQLKLPASADPGKMNQQYKKLASSFDNTAMRRNPEFKKIDIAYKLLKDVFDLKG